ncbi:SH3 domain-containing protein [Aquicoccus sp. SU-CL01552]|uniref:SH3 domain-containing protein n=1 Tax=Aquicoccus sp. SU-CL01552 TaxID=3127656 RepID=UPI00310A458F
MPRLIIVSFLILGWTFYELSGGGAFEPRGVRPPRPAPQQAAIRPDPAATAPTAPLIAPRKARDGAPAEVTAATQRAALKARQLARTDRLAQIRQGLGVQLTGFSGAGSGLALTTLEQGAVGLRETAVEPEPVAAPAPPPEPKPDLRKVTGTRVNMRDGPGTIYPVIARLVLGDEVEVLSTSGTGWLRLRKLPERRIGWVAASLISKKAD